VSHVGFFRQVFKTPPAVGHKKRSIFVFLHFCNLQLFFFRGFFRCPASAQRVRAGRQGLELTYTPLKMPLLQMQFLFYRCICTKIGFLIWRDFLSKYLLAARLYMVHPHPIFVFIFCSTPAQLRFALYIQLLYVPFFFVKFLCAKGVALSRIFHTYTRTSYTYSRRPFFCICTMFCTFFRHFCLLQNSI